MEFPIWGLGVFFSYFCFPYEHRNFGNSKARAKTKMDSR